MGHSTSNGPAFNGVAVTKSDSTVLRTTRALWVGGAGDVDVIFAEGTTAVTLAGIAAGTILPVQVTKVMSTNTTATSIVALY
jgi:hypothetical protein